MSGAGASLVAAAIRNRVVYDALAASGEAEHLGEAFKLILAGLATYYGNDPEAGDADPAMVTELACAGMTNPKHREAVADMIEGLCDTKPSAANAQALLKLLAKDRLGHELSVALATRKPDEDIASLMASYQDAGASAETEELQWNGILARRVTDSTRMPLAIKSLNKHLGGGLLPGHNLTLFARPETGKTCLSLTLAVGFAKRGYRVLYCGNEDPGQDLMVRAIMCLTKRGLPDIQKDPATVEQEAVQGGIENLRIRELSPGSLAELERLVRLEKPAVLIVDQLRNVKAKSENMTQRLDAVAQGVRALGKRYKMATISVTQAGDSARGKAVLDDGDIDSSNTGIPGAADVLIGIGMTEEMDAAGLRMLSICKNKITGWRGSFQVRIDPQLSRMTSND